MNILRIARTVLKSKIKEKVPIDVAQTITGKCNLACKYCCFPYKVSELTTEQIKKAISEFSNMGTLFWTFTGGEPTIREDIGQLINHTKDCGIVYTRLLSNGVYWYKKRIDQIKNVDSIVFSMDGNAEVHNEIRGKGSFDSVIESLKMSRERNIDFSLSTVLTKANLSNDFAGLKFMFDLAKEFNCMINFQPVFPLEYQNNPRSEFEPTIEETQGALQLIKEFDKETRLVKFSDLTYEIWMKSLRNELVEMDCLAGKKFCFVSPEGMVMPLPMRFDEAVSGAELGFSNAFQKMEHKHQESCYRFCFPERTNIYNFNLSTIMNYLPVLLAHKAV